MWENICKWYDGQGVNLQNIQRDHTTQYKKKSKDGQNTWTDILPKKKYRWLMGTGEGVQHH